MVIGAKVNKTWNIVLRATIAVFTLFFIYWQVFHERDTGMVLRFFEQLHFGPATAIMALLLLLLMLLNHTLEAIKWQWLIGKLEQVKFSVAFAAVFTGISVSMFLPNRVGDYIGRVFMLRHSNPVRGILVTIIGSIAQLITTLLAGMVAASFFLHHHFDFQVYVNLWLFAGSIILFLLFSSLLLLLYFNIQLLHAWVGKLKSSWREKLEPYVAVYSLYSNGDLFKILLFSILRYMVFSFQFYLLIRLFGLPIAYADAMMLIALSYLLLTIIPTVAISELGVRGSVTLMLFSQYFAGTGLWSDHLAMAVLAASTGLWLLNIALPALLGVFFVNRLKFFRKKNNDVEH